MRSIFTRLNTAYVQHRSYRQTLAALNAMSDAEAEDLGLSRTRFPALAAEAVYGR